MLTSENRKNFINICCLRFSDLINEIVAGGKQKKEEKWLARNCATERILKIEMELLEGEISEVEKLFGKLISLH